LPVIAMMIVAKFISARFGDFVHQFFGCSLLEWLHFSRNVSANGGRKLCVVHASGACAIPCVSEPLQRLAAKFVNRLHASRCWIVHDRQGYNTPYASARF
jgi:hypothetical protein